MQPELPPIPRVEGPLRLRVSYPREGGLVATRAENFIFGSTGSGDARLWINGEPVEVQPNGGFLAFLPVPSDGLYRLRAELAGRTGTLERAIRLPPAPTVPAGDPAIVPATVFPRGAWVALPGERVEVGFQGTAGGTASLVLPDGSRVPLVEDVGAGGPGVSVFEVEPDGTASTQGATGDRRFSRYRGFFAARRLVSADTSVAWPRLTGEPRPSVPSQPTAYIELVHSGRTATRPLPLNLLIADPDRPRVGVGHDPDPPELNGDGRIIGRPGPGGGPYHYTWPNGTALELTGERNGAYRVRLTDDRSAWTPAGETRLAPAGTPPPTSRVETVRFNPQPDHIDVHVALTRRLPHQVEESDRRISLLVFGAVSRINFLQHGRLDPYVERGEWSQPADRLFRLDIHLAAEPWGYETFWSEAGDLVLRIRRPPAIDRDRPLRGLVVGIDPGHGGSDRATMGPTGSTEADANLGIALALRDALLEAGARPVLSRDADTTLSLAERTLLARQRNVDVWISVHNNAFPDGVNPWENNGTSVYYNHPRAAAMARAVQRELIEEFGLRDLGVGRADFHQARFTWAPAILTENMFMMIPRQEAALQRPEVWSRIANAHIRGLERWLRVRADAVN